MEGVVENPPHPAPPADKKTTPIGIFLYIVAFWWLKNGNLSGYGRPASERGAFIPTLEKQMKKKALTLAIAAALSAPASFAATDDSGMRYTSASEGFYASLRVQIKSKDNKHGDAAIDNEGSRFGVRGTNDMGGGLEGFYRWEAGINLRDGVKSDKGNVIQTRLGNVGVRGAFGQIQMGSFWTADYNWVGVGIDQAGADGVGYYNRPREARSKNALEYTTPNLNGFQGAIRVSTDNADTHKSNSLSLWNLAAKYEVQGFTVAGSYNNLKDGIETSDMVAAGGTPATAPEIAAGGTDDLTSWGAAVGYSQNNWDVSAFYGVDSTSDNKQGITRYYDKDGDSTTHAPLETSGGAEELLGKGSCGNVETERLRMVATGARNDVTAKSCSDTKRFGLAGGVTLDKVRINVAWEKVEQLDGLEDVTGGVEVQYKFTANSQVDTRYRIQDRDTNPNAENDFRVVLRHNF